LSNADQVVPAIARALGLRDLGERPIREGIYQWLRPRHVLLVLDNFEHVLPAAAELTDLLSMCPRVTALVTTREALRLGWERLVVVPPLDLPAEKAHDSVERIANSPAVMLFVERARERNLRRSTERGLRSNPKPPAPKDLAPPMRRPTSKIGRSVLRTIEVV
jgi:predicted ATPase